MKKMITPLEAIGLIVDYTFEAEVIHWRQHFDTMKDMLENMRSPNPHAFVLACIAQGMDSEAIAQEWDGGR